MKKLLVIFGSIILIAAMAYPVSAWGPGRGGGYHMGYGGPGLCRYYDRGYDKMTEAQRSQLDNLYQKSFDKTAPLRTQIWTKSGELDTLLGTSSPDPDRVRSLQKEISDLKGKMAQERINAELEARKIAPKGDYFRGNRRAHRWHGGGYGPGGCGN